MKDQIICIGAYLLKDITSNQQYSICYNSSITQPTLSMFRRIRTVSTILYAYHYGIFFTLFIFNHQTLTEFQDITLNMHTE